MPGIVPRFVELAPRNWIPSLWESSPRCWYCWSKARSTLMATLSGTLIREPWRNRRLFQQVVLTSYYYSTGAWQYYTGLDRGSWTILFRIKVYHWNILLDLSRAMKITSGKPNNRCEAGETGKWKRKDVGLRLDDQGLQLPLLAFWMVLLPCRTVPIRKTEKAVYGQDTGLPGAWRFYKWGVLLGLVAI